ncbi:MAG: STAS-like domain-containing protein [Saprospiraceae bacterium]|uniref:STAS-like domain-containing protein n=1 Tax=Candidatus Opimibacter skivensis TaxID=2982028 RepID=A0A9D7XNX6_9BACT|nr:STAS-like domain-containing protein [Candidatus Opimibacter skivensis]
MKIEFKDIGNHLGTRSEARELRSFIISAMQKGQRVVFDFDKVEIISNSFADECFAKLTEEFNLDRIKSQTHFQNASPFVRAVIANSFKERLSRHHASS